MTFRFSFLCALLSSFFLLSCDDSEDPRTAQPTTKDAPQYEKGAWSYDGQTGPEHWAELSSEYAACEGSKQSPINLADASPPEENTILKTSYTSEKIEVVDTGHALQVNTTGGTLTIRDQTYELQQFHVHTPSEHTMKDERYAAEIHLVHRADDQIAVLALLVEEGDTHPHMDDWIEGESPELPYNAGRLLPSQRSYYTYEGSLTMPPCTEGVRWIVMNTPIQASSKQLETLRAHHTDNARPLQSRNDRTLVLVAP